MGPDTLALMLPVIALTIPIVAIVAKHKQKMEEIRLRGGPQADQHVLGELRDLRQQMADLRDTTTRYDLSFDAALQRIESRVGNLENRVRAVEQAAETPRIGV